MIFWSIFWSKVQPEPSLLYRVPFWPVTLCFVTLLIMAQHVICRLTAHCQSNPTFLSQLKYSHLQTHHFLLLTRSIPQQNEIWPLPLQTTPMTTPPWPIPTWTVHWTVPLRLRLLIAPPHWQEKVLVREEDQILEQLKLSMTVMRILTLLLKHRRQVKRTLLMKTMIWMCR